MWVARGGVGQHFGGAVAPLSPPGTATTCKCIILKENNVLLFIKLFRFN